MAEGRGSRILSGFANVVLDRGLPRIRAWLRERLGDDADLTSLRIEGTRAKLRGVRLPFGDAVLWLDDATLALDTTNPRRPRIRLLEMKGELRSAEEGAFRAPLELVSTRDDDPAAWVDGTLKVREATWRQSHGEGESRPLAGSIDAKVTLERWSLSEGHFTGSAAEVWLEASGAMDNSEGRALADAKLVFKQARAGHLVDALEALTKREIPALPLPWTALLTGSIAFSREGHLEVETALEDPTGALPEGLRLAADIWTSTATRGEVTLQSDASRLVLKLYVDEGKQLDGTALGGHLALADLERLGLFRTTWQPQGLGASIHHAIVGELAVKGTTAEPSLFGELQLDRLALAPTERPDVTPFELRDLRADLLLAGDVLRLDKLTARGWGTTLAGGLRWSFADGEQAEPMLTLRLVDADASLVEQLGQLPQSAKRRLTIARDGKRPSNEMWLAADARLTGDLTMKRDRSTRGSFALETRQSALMLSLVIDGAGALDGSTLVGRVTLHDALLAGLFDGAMRPQPEGLATLDAKLTGSTAEPTLQGRVRTEALKVDAAGLATLALERVTCSFAVDEEAFVYRDLLVEGYGGQLRGDGVVGLSERFDGSDATLVARDLRVADLPLGERTVGRYLEGTAGGEVHLRQRSAEAPYTGRGEIVISDPLYPGLAQLAGKVKEVGLPLPPSRGPSPASAKLTFDGEGLRIAALRVTLDGCRLEGVGNVAMDRALQGEATLHLTRRYLSRSVLLVVPTWFTGDLAVPIALSGSTAAPEVEADVGGAMRRAFGGGAVGEVVSDVSQGIASASEGIASAFDGMIGKVDALISGAPAKAREPGQGPPSSDDELDALVDRIMKDDPDTERLIDALIDAGVTEDDIVRVLERRRLRF